MAKTKTDDAHYKAIAAKIKQKFFQGQGRTLPPLYPPNMAEGIDAVAETQFKEGVEATERTLTSRIRETYFYDEASGDIRTNNDYLFSGRGWSNEFVQLIGLPSGTIRGLKPSSFWSCGNIDPVAYKTQYNVDFKWSSSITSFYQAFTSSNAHAAGYSLMRSLPAIDLPINDYRQAFQNLSNLKNIELIGMTPDDTCLFTSMFNSGNSGITEIRFTAIGANGEHLPLCCPVGLSLAIAVNLSHDSLMSLINNLRDITSEEISSRSVTVGAENLAKLTDAEIAIATQKGWNFT